MSWVEDRPSQMGDCYVIGQITRLEAPGMFRAAGAGQNFGFSLHENTRELRHFLNVLTYMTLLSRCAI